MKKLFVFLAVVLCFAFASAQSICPQTATIDGVTYAVVQVGSQCWTASNMRNTHYSDGAEVMPVPLIFVSSMAPDFDVTRYGYLYTPAAATREWAVVDNEIQGICPEGWRIPMQADMSALLAQVSVEQLMASEDWLPQGGSNTVGFNLLPAGICNGTYNSFENYRVTTMLLTAEPSGTMVYHPCKFGDMCGSWEFIPGRNNDGYSVRCVRDAEAPAAMSVTTDSATTVTSSGAKLYGNVTSLGDNAQVTAGFRYGQHPDYMAFKVENTASATGSYNAELTGISPNTTYYFQAYAATATDTVWAADTLAFTTLTNPCQGTAKGNEHASSNGIDSVRDSKGNSYLTVQIGSQCWMAQNLRTETVLGSYNPSTEEERYDVENYGLLYTWDTAAIICPQGWHLPSNTEWNTLSATAGVGMSDEGTGSGKLAGGCIWNDNYDGAPTGAGNYLYPLRDSTGFSALPTGAYHNGLNFHSFGGATQFWCANSGASAGNAECYTMYHGNEYNFIEEAQTENLISVRCVRDEEAPPFTCGTSKVKDIDGNEYNTVQIGNQCWMKENLRTNVGGGVYPKRGTEIVTGEDTITYGRLYTWDAMMKGAPSTNYPAGNTAADTIVHGICPEGWHVPSNAEWDTLTTYVKSKSEYKCGDNAENIAKAFSQPTGWSNTGTGCNAGNTGDKANATGFSAVPAGGYSSSYYSFGLDAYFWSATEYYLSYLVYVRGLDYNNANVGSYPYTKENGFSVRCLRDAEVPAAMSVTTDSANTVTKNGATLYGNVTSLGTYDQVNAGFKYGTSDDALTTIVTDGYPMLGSGRFNFNITGLTANTQYFYKAFAANGSDTVYGEVKDFTTAADIVTDTIAFLPNGGQSTMDTMFVTRGNTALNANTYTHDGNWEFLGWNTEADGTGTHYDNQATITTNGNLTLYAQWGTWCTGTPSDNEVGNARIDSVKDVDNNKYAVVQIGNQCWMKQNLRTSTNDAGTGNIYTPTTAGYDVETYGRLYDWAAVMQGKSSTNYPAEGEKVQGICPAGWHVPSDAEWDTLTYYVYNSTDPDYKCSGCSSSSWIQKTECIAKALAATTGWAYYQNNCTVGNTLSRNNATGFSALPAGYINSAGTTLPYPHNFFGDAIFFISATEGGNVNVNVNVNDCCVRGLSKAASYVSSASNTPKTRGLSVRCVRDAEAPAAMSVTTDSATAVTNSSAKLYGTVASLGDNEQVTAGFRYGQHPDYMTFKAENTASATGSYNAELTGISPNTTYYFQAYAATATDTAYAADTLTFTTLTVPCSVNALRAGTSLGGDKYANKEYGADSKIDSVSDHEGNVYRVVEINGQCWLAENMRCTTSPRQGTVNLQSGGSSGTDYNNPKYYDYNSNAQKVTNSRARGLLYNWAGAMDSVFTSQPEGVDFPNRRGICPEGWHLPTDDDWFKLEKNVLTNASWASVTSASGSGTSYRGTGAGKLTGGCVWSSSNTTAPNSYSYADRNNTGFSALPVGRYFGSFSNSGKFAYFWSATSNATQSAWYRGFNSAFEGVNRNEINEYGGFSVRCVRD